MKIIKILIILAVGALSLFVAVHFTGEYVAEVNEKDKTLAEVIIQNQFEEELNKAESEAKEELGEALVTTVLTTKPVTTTTSHTTASTEAETTVSVTTTTAVTTAATTTSSSPLTTTLPPEEIITEFTRGGILPADRKNIPFKTMFTLTESEQQRFITFLVEHYFLDGDLYVNAETRSELKEKKRMANEMEKSAISALNLVMDKVNIADITSIMSVDYTTLKAGVTAIRDEFQDNYKDAYSSGEQYGKLHDDSLVFMNRLIEAVGKLQDSAKKYNESTNAFFAAIILASAVEDVIIPEIMAVLEQSFDLVEITQDIFLEGTQGTRLLSRDEVTEIITNPALILDTGLA